jgi:hypothetical protein
VIFGTIASLFAPFGILMPKGEKSSSRPLGICMVLLIFIVSFHWFGTIFFIVVGSVETMLVELPMCY